MPDQEGSLALLPFQLAHADRIEHWLQGPGLGVPPGRAGRDWAERMLADPRIRAWVAYLHEEPVGFVRFDMGLDRVAELTIAVAPDHRRQGVGRAILAQAATMARNLGLRRLHAVIDPANTGGHKFFLEAGFEEAFREVSGQVRLMRLVHGPDAAAPLEIEL